MTNALATISAGELPTYLHSLSVVPDGADVTVTPLGGGISAVVLLAEWPGGAVVVKQPRTQLAVDEEWIFDPARAFVERDCLDVLAERMPGAAPELVFVDDERFVVGMTAAPAGGVLWRDEHDRGVADPRRTDQAARLLGRLHATTVGDAVLAERFAAQWPLLEGRIEPYHRATARRHPDLAARIEEEVARLLAARRCLVHGDFSPKNLIAYPDRMLMLDFEVAHWGDPAFDVAFVLALVLLDGIRHGDGAFARQAFRFWQLYRREAGAAAAAPADVVAELGCIVLARVDGKSRLPHLTDGVADSARRYARALLTDLRRASVEDALAACP
jgi:aminoglycoside phosphotransferase (APT) family kinase protein